MLKDVIRAIMESEAFRKKEIILRNKELWEDEHNHTTDSDGGLTAADLIIFHWMLGFIKGLVITDHDFVLTEDDSHEKLCAKRLARALGIELSYGAEISSFMDISFLGIKKKRMGFHVVIRDFNPDDPEIRKMFLMLKESREERAVLILKKIKHLHPELIVPENFEKKRGVITTTDIVIKLCELNPGLDFREFLGHLQGHNYQVVQNKVEIFELLEIVAAAGGYCVLAHPVKTMKKYFVYLDEIVGRLSEKGLFGVEAFARKQDKEQTAEIIRMCGKHNIRYYAGADTHELKDLLRYIETMAEVL